MGGKWMGGARINRQEAMIAYAWLRGAVMDQVELIVVGSYRRAKDDLGDLDVVAVVKNDFDQRAVDYALQSLFGKQKNGKPKTTGVVLAGAKQVQVDVLVTSAESRGAAKLHLTGSAQFNIRMRAKAKKLGFLLNQLGLTNRKTGEKIAGETEDSIFEALDMEYVYPEDRE